MTTTEIEKSNGTSKAEQFELALVAGDLSKLSPDERLSYYQRTCESLGLNSLTKPFAYITLNGKLTLYALRDATDQLRKLHAVSIAIVSRERIEDVYVVTARATLPNGRVDESTGAVTIGSLKGDALANALMKAETKAKRRVTLSVCGLGTLDETEIETIKDAKFPVERPPTRKLEAKPSPSGGDETGSYYIDQEKGVNIAVPVDPPMNASLSIDQQAQVLIDALAEVKTKDELTTLRQNFASWPDHDEIADRADVKLAYGRASQATLKVKR